VLSNTELAAEKVTKGIAGELVALGRDSEAVAQVLEARHQPRGMNTK
jgi:hypothetical protein